MNLHNTSSFLRHGCALLALLLSLFLPAAAQRGAGDDGEYQILQASYGTAQRNIDVTQRLKELARQDRSFRMGNDTFGVDPDPGQRKTLRIYARGKNGQNRSFEYGEGSVVDGAQFTGWGGGDWGQGGWHGGWGGNGPNPPQAGHAGRLYIVSASYGAGNRKRDITARLRGHVRGDRLSVTVDNRLAGTDPAPGITKTLSVSYTVGGGKTRQVRVDESETLNLP